MRPVSPPSPSSTVPPNAAVSSEPAARPTEVSATAASQLPAPTPPTQVDGTQANVTLPAPVPAEEGKAMMRIDFNAECWVSLQTMDRKRVDRIYKSGESLSVPVAKVSALVLGNAPAAKATLAGRQVNLMASRVTQGNVTRLDQQGIQLLLKN